MSKNQLFIVLIAVVVAGVVGYGIVFPDKPTKAPPLSSAEYDAQIRQTRAEKDEVFRTSEQSPIYEDDRPTFKGLKYFEPDLAFKIKTKIDRFDTSIGINVEMTHSEPESYKPFGTATFVKDDTFCRLLLFKTGENATQIFVAFRDATTLKESYGGGRYLEIPMSELEGDSLTIDFNLAFNPFCCYNPTYSCPVPPKENNLPIAIRAGERKWGNY